MTPSNLQTLQALSLDELIAAGRAQFNAEMDEAKDTEARLDASTAEMQSRIAGMFHESLGQYVTVPQGDYSQIKPGDAVWAALNPPNALRISVAFTVTETGLELANRKRGSFQVWHDGSEWPVEETNDLGRAVGMALQCYVEPPAPKPPAPKPPAPPPTDWLAIATQHLDNSTTSTFCADAEVRALRAIAAALIDIANTLKLQDR